MHAWCTTRKLCYRKDDRAMRLIRDIAAFVLFSTPPLVSPKFIHVPLGVGGWSFGYEERRCWANLFAVSKIFNLCGHDSPTSQTDGQTDDMRMQDRALHYNASRGKKRKRRNYARASCLGTPINHENLVRIAQSTDNVT